MEASSVFGFLLVMVGAFCGGSWGLPSKFAKKETPWETLWCPFFFFVTILLPVMIFPLLAQGLFASVSDAGWKLIALPVIFGFLWGLGSMTLGLSFTFIGLSLAYAINGGAQIAFGSMGPFIIHHPEQLLTTHGIIIMSGVVVCIAGVVACGRAGNLKSQSQNQPAPAGMAVGKGMLIAFLSGVLCACYSVAFSFGGGVMDVATKQHGNPGWQASFVVSALILWGGALSACGYCVFKLFKNKTWGTFAAPGMGRVLLIALIMSLLHDGAILFFGIGASKLGSLGVAVGYAAFISFAIIVGNLNGFLMKEWRGASKQSVQWIISAIGILIVGVCLLATGNFMQGEAAKKPVIQTPLPDSR